MIELSHYAEQMAAQTGFHKDPELRFPVLKDLLRLKREAGAHRPAEREAGDSTDV